MKRITIALPSPYVGLRAFTEKEALLFFGRDLHIRDLLARLETSQRFISVLGASGTGKSSLVRAGLIPALHRGALASAGHSWNVHILKPGNAPIANLAHALTEDKRWIENDDRATSISSLSSLLRGSPLALTELYLQKRDLFANEALLLVVDQLEEIFRYRQINVDEAEAFIRLLLRSASEDMPIYVVMTMRSDFLGNCVAFLGLPEAINSGIYLTPRLGPDQLKSIIASPLALVGGEIDPVMVNRLVNTLGGEDELPVLEHALLCMWYHAKQDGRSRIEETDFNTVCTPRGLLGLGDITPGPMLSFAIDNHASEIYEAIPQEQRAVARQLFLALVEQREGRVVRRPQELHQLVEQAGERERDNVIAVINAFRADGVGFLLPPVTDAIRDETLIDISHESLFRQWRLFQQWLKEEELDVAELKEWQQRALRQQEGGGWLDENDCERAQRWHARVRGRANPHLWASRYAGDVSYKLVDSYIDASLNRLEQIKSESERQQREIREAETRRLELEAKLQRETAERAAAEKLQAEKGRQQAEAFAAVSRRKTRIATVGFGLAMLFFLMATAVAWWANDRRKDALAGELVATAERLARDHPDQSVLLGLAARHITSVPKANADAFIRFARGNYSYKKVLRGHDGWISNANFSPDGKTILTASRDTTARLWDADSGKELHVLRGHKARVFSAQFSADGKAVVTSSEDNTARLWEAASGRELHVLDGHSERIYCAQFSHDGKAAVTASEDQTARLWDVATGNELHVLRGHKAPVLSAQFSPDGKTVVTASGDNTARMWDAASGKELQVLRGHEGSVLSAQFSPDGKTVVSASWDNTIRLWDTASGKELQVLRGHEGSVLTAQFSSGGETVASASTDNTARLWDIASGRELRSLRGHESGVNSAQFSPGGKTVVTTGVDKTARLWDVASGTLLQIWRGHEAEVTSAQFSPHGERLTTASMDATARLWDVSSGRESRVLPHQSAVVSAQFSEDGKTVITASKDNTARRWDVASGRELQVWSSLPGARSSVQLSPDGKMQITTSKDKTARLLDVASNKELQVLHGHEDAINSAQFSPGGETVVTASKDKTARLWDVASGRELQVLRGHNDVINSAEFSRDGKTVVTASMDKTVRLWRCEVCRPTNEIDAQLEKTVGRKLRDEERRWFGVTDLTFFSLFSLFSR